MLLLLCRCWCWCCCCCWPPEREGATADDYATAAEHPRGVPFRGAPLSTLRPAFLVCKKRPFLAPLFSYDSTLALATHDEEIRFGQSGFVNRVLQTPNWLIRKLSERLAFSIKVDQSVMNERPLARNS